MPSPEYQEPTFDVIIKRHTTYRVPMVYRDSAGVVVPMVGRSAWLHIRNKLEDTTTLFELTSANNRIILADTSPNITLYIPHTLTGDNLLWNRGEQDLIIEQANGDRKCLFRGLALVQPTVTRVE